MFGFWGVHGSNGSGFRFLSSSCAALFKMQILTDHVESNGKWAMLVRTMVDNKWQCASMQDVTEALAEVFEDTFAAGDVSMGSGKAPSKEHSVGLRQHGST